MIDRVEAERAVREELVRSGMPGRPNRLAEDIVTRVLALETNLKPGVFVESGPAGPYF